ncbi:MAG: ATP-binding protein [Pseudomonadota bacterium]
MQHVEFLAHLQQLLASLQSPADSGPVDFGRCLAARWRAGPGGAYLQGIEQVQTVRAEDLLGIDRAGQLLDRNTRQFVHGLPANDVLLWGGRGTGKSSLVKAMLTRYGPEGLRLIELDKDGLLHLPDVLAALSRADPDARFRFVLFCDDLSFEDNEPAYKALKSVLDGGVEARPANVLIYATSNRRHLMPRHFAENDEYQRAGDEIVPGETAEEKLSLSDRFGLWIGFYPFDQDTYLAIVAHHLRQTSAMAVDWEAARAEALRWALARGSRSGRVARHFVNDYMGRLKLGEAGGLHDENG